MHSTLFFPSIRRGNGTGHLVRCSRAAEILGPETAVILYDEEETIDFESVIKLFPSVRFVRDFPKAEMVLVDQRDTPAKVAESIKDDTCVVVLDESGGLRDSAEFVIDMLGSKKSGRANVRISPTLPINRRRETPRKPENVLITFGGEDPAGLTALALDAFARSDVFADSKIAVVRGPSFGTSSVDSDVVATHLDPDPELREKFFEYDIVITSYGLTAFEARGAGCAVGIVDPSRYHCSLSLGAGYYHLGTRSVTISRLERLGRNLDLGLEFSSPDRESTGELAQTLRTLSFIQRNRCPVCGSTMNRSRERFPRATFFVCACTDLLYRVGFEKESETYSADYFFDSYQRQYGKTYLEDFETIKEMGRSRLDSIAKCTGRGDPSMPNGLSLLDIGCAFGPFLSAAAERGIRPVGIDVSAQAIEYVRSELGFEAYNADILEISPEKHRIAQFDLVTLWYVIEHFENLGDLLKRIARWVKPGGLLAFSTPNLHGISGLSRRRRFLSESPKDHFVIFSFRTARRVLEKYGFEVARSKSTGHHPERFPVVGRFPILYPLIRLISKSFRLGDTFEVYARLRSDKVGE